MQGAASYSYAYCLRHVPYYTARAHAQYPFTYSTSGMYIIMLSLYHYSLREESNAEMNTINTSPMIQVCNSYDNLAIMDYACCHMMHIALR